MRRGVLYRLATGSAPRKIALGHHLDDFIETPRSTSFFGGTLKAMRPASSPTTASTSWSGARGRHRKPTPAYAKDSGLPIIGCCCRLLRRPQPAAPARQTPLIAELEVEHPEIKSSAIRALANVAGRHLLDRRQNPLPELHAAAAMRIEEDVAPPCSSSERMRAVVQRCKTSVSSTVQSKPRWAGPPEIFVGVAGDDGPEGVLYIASKVRDLESSPTKPGG